MKTSLITRLEKYSFGVCTEVADRVGISTTSLRKVFIYASFLTLGSPIVIYFTMAFWMQIRQHFNRRPSIWDL